MNPTSSSPRLPGACLLLALGVAALAACGGPAAPAALPTPAADATAAAPKTSSPTAIPHGLEGKEECTSCHKLGAPAPMGMPADHKDRDNAACKGCHQPKAK